MQIQCLGSGGYHPSERRHTACLLLPEVGIALDAGTAAFRLTERLPGSELDLFLSHAHLDHVVGLSYLLVPLAWGRLTRVTVHGQPEVLEAVQNHLFHPALFPVNPPFEYRELVPDAAVQLANNVQIAHWRQGSHPGGSTGYRISWTANGQDRSLCYVTDTTVDRQHLSQIQATDLLIHECYFPDAAAEWAAKTGHSSLTQVLELAVDAAVKRLLLTHIDPQLPSDAALGLTLSECQGIPVSIAKDGETIDL